MLLGQDKKAVTMIVAGLSKPKAKASPNSFDDGEYPREKRDEEAIDARSAKKAAMNHFLKSMKMDDEGGMVDALETFFDLCGSEKDGDEASGVETSYEYED